jgi:hypothetical protein
LIGEDAAMTRRYATIGNCQAAAFADVLRALRPDAVVERVVPDKDPDAAAATLARLAEFDVVFSQPSRASRSGAFRTELLRDHVKSLVIYPVLTFRGFHPDEVGVVRANAALASPLGSLHSQIAVVSFLEGLSPERAERLYNRFVYARLGYFDEYERSMAYIDETVRQLDFPLDTGDLRKLGTFMHSTVHPRIAAIALIVRGALRKAGEPCSEEEIAGLKVDDGLARMARYAIFPEIAGALSLRGDMTFVQHKRAASSGGGRGLLLGDFIRKSYAAYAAAPDADFDTAALSSARAVLKASGLR